MGTKLWELTNNVKQLNHYYIVLLLPVCKGLFQLFFFKNRLRSKGEKFNAIGPKKLSEKLIVKNKNLTSALVSCRLDLNSVDFITIYQQLVLETSAFILLLLQ